MEALQAAAQVVPREPEQAPGSAPAILARWRARAGVALSDEQPPVTDGAAGSHGAWEVCGRGYRRPLRIWIKRQIDCGLPCAMY